MSALLEELVRENVRSLGAALARRTAGETDVGDAADAIRLTLRYGEDVRTTWDRFCDRLATGLDAAKVGENLRSAIAMFDEWLESAARVEALAESVAARTGQAVGSWDELRATVEKVKVVRQSAAECLASAAATLPPIPSDAVAEARELYDQGKYKNLGDVLSDRAARRP